MPSEPKPKPKPDTGEVLTVAEAAERLGVHYQTARKLVLRGDINHVFKGKRKFVPASELSKFRLCHPNGTARCHYLCRTD